MVQSRETAGPIPQEALDFFEAKRLRPGWGDSLRKEVVETMQGSLARALREGQTYAMWKRGLQPQLVRLGFWGQQQITDALTGDVTQVDVPQSLERIFRQNMRTARAAGQWERIQRTKTALPYLLYLLGPYEHPPAEHVAWHGLLLHVDDPFWQTAFPPNSGDCKCHVRQVSTREADRLTREGVGSADRKPVLDAKGLPTGRRTRETVPVRRAAPKPPLGVSPGFACLPNALRRFQDGPPF